MEEKKHTYRDEKEKKDIITRLNRIVGQMNGIKKLIEGDNYCIDILMQTSAVIKAMEAIERKILENHMKNCMSKDIREGNDEAIDETITIIKRMMK